MAIYKHILISTDLSADTDKIVQHVQSIINQGNAQVSIVHVVEHTPIVYGGGEFSIPLDINLEESLKQTATQALRQLGQKFGISESQQYVENGSVKLTVVNLAQQIGADLIVVGTHSRHGVERLLGSTANAILHAAKCDVLTVRVRE